VTVPEARRLLVRLLWSRLPEAEEVLDWSVRAWKQALAKGSENAFPGKGNASALEEELRRLRAEVKRLTMERDVLKKATAFFARESS
jgi:transposase-like protein